MLEKQRRGLNKDVSQTDLGQAYKDVQQEVAGGRRWREHKKRGTVISTYPPESIQKQKKLNFFFVQMMTGKEERECPFFFLSFLR